VLKKINRSLSRKDFETSRKVGRLYQTPLFGVSVFQNEYDSKELPSQFGFVISKKISKKAVIRNKIRRWLADGVRKNMNSLKTRANFVFLVKTSMLKTTVDDVESEIKNVFEKISA